LVDIRNAMNRLAAALSAALPALAMGDHANAASIFIQNLFKTMKNTQARPSKPGVRRVLVGHPADPASTRELHGATAMEALHIRLAVTAALMEERLYRFLPDTALQAALAVGGHFRGVETPSLETLRNRKAAQADSLRSLEARFDAAGDGPVTGIPRHEFAALIEAMQGALIEADLFQAFNPAEAAKLYGQAKQIHAAMGIGEMTHYDPWADDLPGLLRERIEVLCGVLEAVNQPYEGVEYR
jgi:hypothetical protein